MTVQRLATTIYLVSGLIGLVWIIFIVLRLAGVGSGQISGMPGLLAVSGIVVAKILFWQIEKRGSARG